MSLSKFSGQIENVGPANELILPTDIFVNPVGVTEGRCYIFVAFKT